MDEKISTEGEVAAAASDVKIRLTEFGRNSSVVVDGHDVTNNVNWVSLRAQATGMPRVELGLVVGSVDAELRGRVELSDPTKAALMALGWTPPT